MTQLTDNIFCVEVPDDAHNLRIGKTKLTRETLYAHGGYDGYGLPLGPGTWQFLFTTKEATEEDALQVVEPDAFGFFMNYEKGYCTFRTSYNSFLTLLRSKGCNTDNNYAILKLNDNG